MSPQLCGRQGGWTILAVCWGTRGQRKQLSCGPRAGGRGGAAEGEASAFSHSPAADWACARRGPPQALKGVPKGGCREVPAGPLSSPRGCELWFLPLQPPQAQPPVGRAPVGASVLGEELLWLLHLHLRGWAVPPTVPASDRSLLSPQPAQPPLPVPGRRAGQRPSGEWAWLPEDRCAVGVVLQEWVRHGAHRTLSCFSWGVITRLSCPVWSWASRLLLPGPKAGEES